MISHRIKCKDTLLHYSNASQRLLGAVGKRIQCLPRRLYEAAIKKSTYRSGTSNGECPNVYARRPRECRPSLRCKRPFSPNDFLRSIPGIGQLLSAKGQKLLTLSLFPSLYFSFVFILPLSDDKFFRTTLFVFCTLTLSEMSITGPLDRYYEDMKTVKRRLIENQNETSGSDQLNSCNWHK